MATPPTCDFSQSNMALSIQFCFFSIFSTIVRANNWVICGTPRMCHCLSDHTEVLCIGSQVTVIPTFFKATYRSSQAFTIRDTSIRSIHSLDLSVWKNLRELKIIGNRHLINCDNEKKRLFNQSKVTETITIDCFKHNEDKETTISDLDMTTLVYNDTSTRPIIIVNKSFQWLTWFIPITVTIGISIVSVVIIVWRKKTGKKEVLINNDIYVPTTSIL